MQQRMLILAIAICLFACLFTACDTQEHVCAFGEWAIVKEATETTNGTQKRECEVCGKPETQKYSLNGEVISTSSTPETNVDTDIVITPGVSSFPVIPVAIGGGVLVALIIAVIIIVSKKKK